MLYRRKKEDEYEEVEELAVGDESDEEEAVPDLDVSDSEEQRRLKQIEKLADEKPEDFVKLLRTWLSEE